MKRITLIPVIFLLLCVIFTSCKKEDEKLNFISFNNTTYEISDGFQYGVGIAGTWPNTYGRNLFLISPNVVFDNTDLTFSGNGHIIFIPLFSTEMDIVSGTYNFDSDESHNYDAFTFK